MRRLLERFKPRPDRKSHGLDLLIGTVDCQVSALLLKTRDLLVRQRMQAVNALRGHLGELGIGTAKGLGGSSR